MILSRELLRDEHRLAVQYADLYEEASAGFHVLALQARTDEERRIATELSALRACSARHWSRAADTLAVLLEELVG